MIKLRSVPLAVRLLSAHLVKKTKQGFTLIELLVVVIIIGILASIALPSFLGAQDKARNASVAGNVHTIQLGVEQYATEFSGAYPAPSIAVALLTRSGAGYLPGDKWPRSPWAQGGTGVYQTQVFTAGTACAVLDPPAVTSPTTLKNPNNPSFLGLSSLNAEFSAVTGTVPTTAWGAITYNYGSVEYDTNTNTNTFVVYGTGKKASKAVIAGAISNNGN